MLKDEKIENIKSLMNYADKAMYQSKQASATSARFFVKS
jgi:GGDEF domain-containing protein